MGEYADMAISESIDSYWDWDEDEPLSFGPRRRKHQRVCKHCKAGDLFWGKHHGNWRLFGRDETNTIVLHSCLSRKPIEARRAETGTGSVEDESAVPKECAQNKGVSHD